MPRGMHYGVPLGILYHVLKIFSILNWYLNYTQGQYTGCVGNDYGVYFYMSAVDRIRWRMIDDMGNGIMMCGLNGSGKSTLGKALSKRLGYHFIDNERLFFPKTDPGYLFASPRSKEEAEAILMDEVRMHGDFLFAAVKGDYGEEILPFFRYVVLVETPKEIRLGRVRNRSYQKFGDRMLPEGDLYEQEEAFFQMVAGRTDQYVEEWVESVDCPVIRVDGTKDIELNVDYIVGQMELEEE